MRWQDDQCVRARGVASRKPLERRAAGDRERGPDHLARFAQEPARLRGRPQHQDHEVDLAVPLLCQHSTDDSLSVSWTRLSLDAGPPPGTT